MHNTLTRLQNTFGYLTSCAFFLAFAISTFSLLPINHPSSSSSSSSQSPIANLSVRNVQVVRGRPHYYSPKREEYAHIRFDLDADLSPLFNWNTKQVFVYVSAEYPAQGRGRGQGQGQEQPTGKEGGMNKAVIWDAIIPAPATKWSLMNVRERYFPSKKASEKTSRRRHSSKSNKDQKSGKTTTDLTRPGLLALKNQKPKYQITDPSGVISSRLNATLTLSWNVQPWVGPLLWDRGMLEDKNGTEGGGVEGSWNLPFLKYQWRGGDLPRSGRFDFPPLKGAAGKTAEVPIIRDGGVEGAKTPEGAEITAVI